MSAPPPPDGPVTEFKAAGGAGLPKVAAPKRAGPPDAPAGPATDLKSAGSAGGAAQPKAAPGHAMGKSLASQLARFKVDNTRKQPVKIEPKGVFAADAKRAVRIVAVSDVHMNHERLTMPDGDILVVSGDFTENSSKAEIAEVNRWLGTLGKYKHRVVIAGNHEHWLASLSMEESRKVLSNATHYLRDSGCECEGIKFWGSPWVPNMDEEPHMRFWDNKGFYQDAEGMRASFAKIPADTAYLVTHSPPQGTLDVRGLGSKQLAERLPHLPHVKVHQFGHVHGGYGTAIVDRPLAKGTETKADSKGDAKSTSSGAGSAGAGAAAGDATKTAPSEGGTVKTLFINAAMDSDEQPWFFDFYV